MVERKAASESAVIDRRNQDARLGVKGEIMKVSSLSTFKRRAGG